MKDTKLIGDISEMMVTTELLKNNFIVLKPIGDRLPYDLCIDLNGKLIRIQIKTASYNKKNDHYIGNVRNSKTNRKKYSYIKCNTKDVDFFIYVIQEKSIFYILPSKIIDLYKSAISFSPHKDRDRDNNKIEEYCNNFDVILPS